MNGEVDDGARIIKKITRTLVFLMRAPSSTDVPVLLLIQHNTDTAKPPLSTTQWPSLGITPGVSQSCTYSNAL